MTETFKQGLDKLNFFTDEKVNNGFYWVNEIEKVVNPYIRIALEKAKKFDVDAVYFRLFDDGRSPIPQIYIYDYTSKPLDKKNIAENHRRIWSSCQVPLFFIFTSTEIKIFNSFDKPKFNENGIEYYEYEVFQIIEFASSVDERIKGGKGKYLSDFSGKNFDNGSFWDKPEFKNDFHANKSAYETLIKKLKDIRTQIIGSNILSKDLANKLLVMSIFVKYLEDRKDKNGHTVFPKEGEKRRDIYNRELVPYNCNYFQKYNNASEFKDVFNNNAAIVNLFNDLSIHFNGEIFKLTSEEEKTILEKRNLYKFAEFLEGKTENFGQLSIWKLYSFEDMPIEVISNIYESLIIEKEKHESGVVYTPPFLVNFLLDSVLPLDRDTTDCKILDPACGSGIFLVQAYKRLIQIWRKKNNWKSPDLNVLKNILTKNIFGVDISEEAIRVTAFSLSLALCDELEPLIIWDKLTFDDLKKNKNLIKEDFFKLVVDKHFNNEFDLIIGNPPFIQKLSSDALILEQNRINNGLCNLPETYSLTFLFLEESKELLKENGNLFLLFPADAFLHKKETFDFYKYFIQKNNIPYIIDFTPLRRVLFPSATVGVIAINLIKSPNLNLLSDSMLHVIMRRVKSSKEKYFFELDKYDLYNIPLKLSLQYRYIWKTNLFGIGKRSYDFVEKYFDNNEQTFLNYLETKYLNRELSKKSNNYPLVIIKKNTGEYPLQTEIFKNKKSIDSYFLSESFKIYSASENEDNLLLIKNIFDYENDIFKFLILSTSDRAGLSRSASTILTDDIKSLPFSDEKLSDNLTEIEKILLSDGLKYYEDFIRLGENSRILDNISSKSLDISQEILNQYAETFLMILNSVYKNYKAYDWVETDNHIIFPFYWGDKSTIKTNISDMEQHLNSLLQFEKPEANLRYIRILTIYDNNVIYFIKPKQYRYWLRSIAIRDADDTFSYLVKQEYKI